MWKTEQKVQRYVEKYRMIQPGSRLVAGISGGADSVCLLYLLKQLQKKWDFEILAVHVNHQLRGAEADRDEEFVKRLCTREKIRCFVVHKDVSALARESGISLEEAGRDARYAVFEEICGTYQGDTIVLAHHQDDLAETMIHHLARGTGMAGLCSLKPVSGKRIRPLLCLDRDEIESYLRERKKGWQTDSTNLEDDYTRNKIRHHVVSYLRREINPCCAAHMAGTAEELEEVEELLCCLTEEKRKLYVKREKESILISEKMRTEAAILQKRMVMEELKQTAGCGKDFSRVHIEEIMALWEKQVGKQLSLPYGITAYREYEEIRIGKEQPRSSRAEENVPAVRLLIPGETQVGEYVIKCEIIACDFFKIEEKKYTKWFDYDNIKGNLEFRHRCPGDRISVHPSGGSKKLKDYLIDRKIPQAERDALFMIADGQEILWVIGDRISQKYKVSDTTEQILHITIKGGNIYER